MSTIWNTYPPTYREHEVQSVLSAVQAGDCVSLIGLSGSGKSNLMGFLAHRTTWPGRFSLIDLNRLRTADADAFFRLIYRTLGGKDSVGYPIDALFDTIAAFLVDTPNLCLLLDRFDALGDAPEAITSPLRALRDAFKYQLTFVTATRRPILPDSEIAELVFSNTFWIGPLGSSDINWNLDRYAQRKGVTLSPETRSQISLLSWGYPSLLRAIFDAHGAGCELTISALTQHPTITSRVAEFWTDAPTEEMLSASGLAGQPLLEALRPNFSRQDDIPSLTAKEHDLMQYFISHPNQVCEKDTLIQAIWPEDKIFSEGIRDDSLSQLVRRLRLKIEPDPADPQHIQTITGRGYLYRP